LLVVDVSQAGDLSDHGSIITELIGMDDLWDIIFSQQPGQEGFHGFGVSLPLKKNVEHETLLVYGPPQPISDAVHARTHLILSANSGAVLNTAFNGVVKRSCAHEGTRF
jgi:hypothetical protein